MRGLRSLSLAALGGLAFGVMSIACDIPECDFGPSNLTEENTASCQAPPSGAVPEAEVYSAGAVWNEDGELEVTISSLGMSCGQKAEDFGPQDNCNTEGWVITMTIPAELAVVGTLDMSEHPEITGVMNVHADGSGKGAGTYNEDEPFFSGTLQLLQVDDSCFSAVVRDFGHPDLDPTLGGPELNGAFVAPVCE